MRFRAGTRGPEFAVPQQGTGAGSRAATLARAQRGNRGWELGGGTLTSKRARELGARGVGGAGSRSPGGSYLRAGRRGRGSRGEVASRHRLCGRVGARP